MEKTMIKYEAVPHYEEVECIGITCQCMDAGVNGSIARNDFVGRRILTEAAGFDPASTDESKPAAQVAKGDGTRLFQTVAKAEETEVFVELADGYRAPALKIKGGYTCIDTKDNKGARILYLHKDCRCNDETLAKIRKFVGVALDRHPEAFDEWKLVDGAGARVFLYLYSDVDANGKGVPQD